MEKDHVLVRGRVKIEAIVRRALPAAEFEGKRSVFGNPVVQIAKPMLPPLPDLRMIFHDGILIDGKREEEVGVKMQYAGFHCLVEVQIAF